MADGILRDVPAHERAELMGCRLENQTGRPLRFMFAFTDGRIAIMGVCEVPTAKPAEEKKPDGPPLPCARCQRHAYPHYKVAGNGSLCEDCADKMAECPHERRRSGEACPYCGAL